MEFMWAFIASIITLSFREGIPAIIKLFQAKTKASAESYGQSKKARRDTIEEWSELLEEYKADKAELERKFENLRDEHAVCERRTVRYEEWAEGVIEDLRNRGITVRQFPKDTDSSGHTPVQPPVTKDGEDDS